MTTKDVIEHEKRSFHKQMKELKLLPNKYFKIGIGAAIISFIGMLFLKYLGDYGMLIQLLRNVMLVSLLVITVSKDKEEDEMTMKLRSQAFVLAFIWGVLYAAVQPIISIIANFFMSTESEEWTEMSMYQVLLLPLQKVHFQELNQQIVKEYRI